MLANSAQWPETANNGNHYLMYIRYLRFLTTPTTMRDGNNRYHDDDCDNDTTTLRLTNKTKQLSSFLIWPNLKNSHSVQVQEGLLQV